MPVSRDLVTSFYEAFARRDGDAMVACYHPDVVFSDPVFPDLRGSRAGEMWRMLCARGKDLVIELGDVSADGSTAHWEAKYTFSGTGRKVHNVIDATFKFKDAKIVEHRDSFDLWRWAGMALGAKGTLLGWTPLVKGAIRKTAANSLAQWIEKRAS
jgi:ketosteroid isomerase-like protein